MGNANYNLYDVFRRRFPVDRSQLFAELPDGKVYSYADLEAISARYANLLRHSGVMPGDRVAAQVEKSPESLFLYLACLRAGAAFLPLNTAYQQAEIAYFLEDAGPTCLVCRPEDLAELTPRATACGARVVLTLDAEGGGSLSERSRALTETFDNVVCQPDDLVAILYTSGTTGRAKGAMLSGGNLASNADALHRLWGFVPNDILLHGLPIFHTHGLFVAINCTLMNGGRILFLPRFDAAEVLQNLHRATVFMGVPTHYVRLLAEIGLTHDACKNMRLFISGSAPLMASTFNEFRDRTGHTILERYGMTETNMNTSNPLDGQRIAGTVGLPLPGVEVRVTDDDGEVLPGGKLGVLELRGPNVFSGYWRQPEATAAEFRSDRYFITGDLARIDANGYVSIVGRAKDMIISGGFNVYPKEIEDVIDGIDGVGGSAVIGLPHPEFGEAVTAVVTCLDPSTAPSPQDIIDRVKETLANYKVPKKLFIVANLPRNVMGKIQKNELRSLFHEAYSANAANQS
jgi:malonyl-CoA/methylmalonyl-CoA synthetase